MKNLAGAVILFFVLLFAYTKLAGPIPFSVNSISTMKTDTFTVLGEGKVIVPPDIAVINVGVQANGGSVKQVQDELNRKINAVSEAVKRVGVKDADIQTSNYSIYPQYDYQTGGQRITGYQASSNLTVKVRDIDRANDVIDGATAAGANQVGGMSFDVDDKTKAQNEAREKAVAEAKRKAQDAARIAGFRLGNIVNYQESFGGGMPPVPLMARAEADKAMGAPTQVEPGSSEIVVTVSLSYELQ